MTNVESAKKYSIIAASCFAVLVVYNIYNAINSYDAINSRYFLSFSDFFKLYYSVILVCVIFIGFTVTLFLKNRLAVTIVSGIYALFHVYYITCMNQRLYYVVEYFSMFVSRGYYDPFLYLLADLLGLLAVVAVVIILIMSLKNKQITKNIWFIGAALLFVGTLIVRIRGGYFSDLSSSWKGMLDDLVEIVALLFVGLWAKKSITYGETAPVKEHATFAPQSYSAATSSNDVIGGADKLMNCSHSPHKASR